MRPSHLLAPLAVPRKELAYRCMYLAHWPVRDDPYELDR